MNFLGKIPDGFAHLKHTILNKVDRAAKDVTNYVAGRSAENKDGRMKLYPPPPFAGRAGQDLGHAKKIANGVFGFVGAPLIAIAYAPLASYKNTLLDKKNQLEGKLNSPEVNIRTRDEDNAITKEQQINENGDLGDAELWKSIDHVFLNEQLAIVNKKLDKVDKQLSKMSTADATRKSDLKNLTTRYDRENDKLNDMKLEKRNNEAYLLRLNLDAVTKDEVKNKVRELTLNIQIKETELKQLKGEIDKINNKLKGFEDTFEDEI